MKAVSLILVLCGAFALAAPGRAFSQAPAAASTPTYAPTAARVTGFPVPGILSAPTPTLEQRVAGLEAYIANSDPRASLRGPDGVIPPGLTMDTVGLPGPGHDGFMMIAAALVLFMTLPGLALSYAGLVRRKNVLSVLAQCFGIAGLATILWWAVGYSLVFSAGKPWLGGLHYAWLAHVGSAPNTDYSFWVSHNVFAMFELMFSIITPAIIVGATAERMRFAAVLSFVGLWLFVVYYPVAHMMWGVDGAMNGLSNPNAIIKSIDFAGGTVVHMTSGWSSLVLCIMLGRRAGYGKEKMPPHSIVLCMTGTAMLWVGWYGFNAGSALGADGIASNAFLTTTLSAAVGSAAWAFAEWVAAKKSSVLGFCSGAIGGLVLIAPSCGFVNATGAVILGLVGGIVPYFAVVKMKAMLGYDDALDAFGVHAVGGTLGILLVGFLARSDVNPHLATHLGALVGRTLWIEQIKAILVVMTLSIVGSLVVGAIVSVVIGFRPSREAESIGLDLTEHGEEGYIL
jgi:Amt family ammonium transporter